ncbi:hypothetical protein TWF569_000274 [Orbilia oligospora]|uniref:Protein-serine/threonine kinase n=1 Tax=Orbilia oligospora TaxID=2813651 RepID=A0A7C8K849_ORBOL|nr:hypothetical protein TWF703_006762 [Orbilia oligospora]KAF3154295.1 hypothetical protein TWF569_000274 [Orbilia oligospora]
MAMASSRYICSRCFPCPRNRNTNLHRRLDFNSGSASVFAVSRGFSSLALALRSPGPPRSICQSRSQSRSSNRSQHNRNVTSPRATATSSSSSSYSTQSSQSVPSSSSSSSSSPSPRSSGLPQSRTPSFDREVAQLATLPLHPLTLSDLVRFGKPPLSPDLLLASASFTLRVLPIRIARRILSLRNLPYIVVSNPHISQIYNNYLHSLRLLLSFPKENFPSSLKEEARFNDVLSEIVDTHSNTIPSLARGFSECKRYVAPDVTTDFLEEHLRARIGTRLLAEQHLALHDASLTSDGHTLPGVQATDPKASLSTYIGTIDTHLNPTSIVKYCADFVGDICDMKYGVRPTVIVDGMTDAKVAYVPSHLEYILTELLKNAFRATIEKGNVDKPIIVTIASAGMERYDDGSDSDSDDEGSSSPTKMLENGESSGMQQDDWFSGVRPGTEVQGDGLKSDILGIYGSSGTGDSSGADTIRAEAARAVTIRIRDRGGGIAPEHLPLIFKYSFTTFNNSTTVGGNGGYGANDAGGLDVISTAMNEVESSTIAGLGFGMGLSRSYAQFFGGDLKVESLFGWGTDVYLGLRGLDVDR